MIPFLIAGSSVLTTLVAPEPVETINYTLLGVKVKSKEVVCRNQWGVPMMPDSKGSYSLIAPPDPVLIERSLIQPPKTDAPTFVPGKPYKLASMPDEPEKTSGPAEPLPLIEQPASAGNPAPGEEPVVVDEPEVAEEPVAAEEPPAEAPAE
jgi:hypothetical protein